MKLYRHLTQGRFLLRINRFAAQCRVGDAVEVCHLCNTGRLGELLLPGALVWLEESDNPRRKTRYDLVCVEAGGYVVNIDSMAPNAIFAEWAEAGRYLPGLTALRAETVFGASRFDYSYLRDGVRGFVELKGVTLFDTQGTAYFPDAPTLRGVKHLRELISARRAGCEAGVCFVLQRQDVAALKPNDRTQPEFGQALREASAAGVRVSALCCRVTPDSCTIDHEVPVLLD